MPKYVAVDLGASSGRVICGDLTAFEVMHRFPTRSERVGESIHWDILAIFSEIKKGLRSAFEKHGSEIVSIGIDTWGVDHGLLDQSGRLLGNPFHYRDGRTDGMIDAVTAQIPRDMLYAETGIGFMSFNTIYQLAGMSRQQPELLAVAHRYLAIPDLLHYWLTGVMANEFTHATTTQLFNPHARDWAWSVIDRIGLPRRLFGPVVAPGTVLGPLKKQVAVELGAPGDVQVVAVACHDTACAVAAAPALPDQPFVFLSSGTWSLLGVELEQPLTTPKAMAGNFSNEGAANGRFRFLKNIMGMWLQEECLREWLAPGEKPDYPLLAAEAESEAAFPAWIDPTDPAFMKPGTPEDRMPDRIVAQCRAQGMPAPETRPQFMAAIYRGLAKCYAQSIEEIRALTGVDYRYLHVIGGGSVNPVLNAWTAAEAGVTVVAGPVEATALGNIIMQAVACGALPDPSAGRAYIRSHQSLQTFSP